MRNFFFRCVCVCVFQSFKDLHFRYWFSMKNFITCPKSNQKKISSSIFFLKSIHYTDYLSIFVFFFRSNSLWWVFISEICYVERPHNENGRFFLPKKMSMSLFWLDLIWPRFNWIGLPQLDLNCFGLTWLGSAWFGLV